MEIRIKDKKAKKLYVGKTSPVPLSLDKLGLTKYNLKLVFYEAGQHKGMTSIYKSLQFTKWLDSYRARGIIEILYAGKSGTITTIDKEYQQKKPIGILFIPYADAVKNFSGDSTRAIRMKVSHFLWFALVGRGAKKGILHYLNQREWQFEIMCNNKVIGIRQGFKEHEASIELAGLMGRMEKAIGGTNG